MLDLRRLEVLCRFAALGSITAAAADLGYSASAVSQQLATLEREAGVALLERTAHSANLTDAGRELVEHAAVILASAEEAQSRMRARAGMICGRVFLSCIPGLAVVLAPHFAALQRKHPDLSLVVHETDSRVAAVDVTERRSDLAIIDDWTQEPAPTTSGLTVRPLRREQVVLAVPSSHRLAGTSGPVTTGTLCELTQADTWLSAPAGQLSRVAGDERLAEIGARPARRWEFEGLDVLAALVNAGAGIALLPAGVVQDYPLVTALPLKPRMHRRVLALTRSTTQQDPAIAICLRAAQQALALLR